jgi:hypothetical protein
LQGLVEVRFYGQGTPGTVTPVVDQYMLPVSPFGPALAWVDTVSASTFQFYDTTLGSNTLTFMEDLTGNGWGFGNDVKVNQPTATAGNAPYFGPVTWLSCVNCQNWQGQSGSGNVVSLAPSFINGLGRVTIGAAFNLDPAFSGSALRVLFAIDQNCFYLQFTTADKMTLTLRPNPPAGATHTTPSTGAAVSRNVNHQVVASVDVSNNPWLINLYLDGALYLADTFASAGTTFSPPTGDQYIGNSAVGITDEPFVGKVGKFVAINSIVSGVGTSLQTYLAGAWT